jgi:uncharacterized protein YegP (UPF0339 family)
MTGKRSWIELWQGNSGRWYFHKKSPNGKITMDSQGYKQRRYAKVAIKREFPNLKVVELEKN